MPRLPPPHRLYAAAQPQPASDVPSGESLFVTDACRLSPCVARLLGVARSLAVAPAGLRRRVRQIWCLSSNQVALPGAAGGNGHVP